MTAGRSAMWPRAAVFDCDGLLVDSTHCWLSAYADVCRSAGRSLEDIDVAALSGASVAGAARRLARELDCPVDVDRLREAIEASFIARPPAALQGAAALVEALGAQMPLAVASNAPYELVSRALTHNGLRSAFTEVVTADDVTKGKPAPDIYLEASRRLGVDPSDAIAFEDSALGARSARAAGLVVVGVPSAPSPRLDADLVVGSLDDERLLSLLGIGGAAWN